MSALENPPAMPPAWQDPSWASMEQSMAAVAHTPGSGQHLMHHHPHHPQHPHAIPHDFYQHLPHSTTTSIPAPVQTAIHTTSKEMMNSSSNSDHSSEGGKQNNNNNKRTVNFKLEIKPEPPGSTNGGTGDENQPQNGIQKVPSISDLSEAESSLDIIPSQVSFRRKSKQ